LAMTMEKRKTSKNARKDMNQAVAGVDLGDSESLATLLSADGDVVKAFSFSMGGDGMALFAENVPRDARIAFEATMMAYPFSRSLKSLGYSDITVAHPTELAWIVRSKKKNDKADSLKIARLHLARMLPESHLLDKDEQVRRDLLIQRVKLGREVGKTKTIITSYLKREGVYTTLPQTSRAFSLARREAMRSQRFNDDRDLVVDSMMEKLEFLEKQSTRFEERVKVLVRESDDVRLLMTIPGVDYYLASLLSSYIGDINRFPDSDHLASFFGIIPESKDSSRVTRRGKMSKDGPSIARWALSMMADTVMKTNPRIKEYYQHHKDRQRSGALAHVKTMKKLLRMVDHMLRTREHWKWEDESLTKRKVRELERQEEGGDAA
jgi:transposase